MGWASAGDIFDQVADALLEADATSNIKTTVLGPLIDALQAGDWDTEDESLERYRHDPVIVALFADRGIYLHPDEPPTPAAEDPLRRAAALVRERANAAPCGPYTLDPTPGYHRQILAADGDPIGSVRDWPGGIGVDTGDAEQTAAHLTLWHPDVARAAADLLDHHADVHGSYECDEANEGAPCSTRAFALALLGEAR